MKIYCRMEMGPGKREIEDRILVDGSILAGGSYFVEREISSSPFTLAIADGVGGNSAGYLAAHLASEGVASFNIPEHANIETISQIIKETNYRIIEKSEMNFRFHRMASTLTGLCHIDERWYLFHVGNSRLYSWNRPRLKQLTTDHSWVREMRLRGEDEETIRNSGRTTEITSCLGNGDPETANQLTVSEVTEVVQSADKLLLTTDGVHEYIKGDVLESAFRSIEDADKYMEQAMKFARKSGSEDDMSMMIAELR